ncbi:MAG: hypothetical protein ACPH6D_09075, partial [Candidatus Puniceispirillales bacterium]
PLGLTKFYNGKEQKLPLPACETANSVPKSPKSLRWTFLRAKRGGGHVFQIARNQRRYAYGENQICDHQA